MIFFAFSGQGSQYVGMSKKIPDCLLKREYFETASNILGFDLFKLCEDGPLDKLSSTEITQPSIYVISAIYDVLLKNRGIKPDLVAGHSLGEYSALYSASVFSFEDGLKLVKKRGELMKKASLTSKGAMLAVVGLSLDIISTILENSLEKGEIVIANYNTNDQFVLSGRIEAIEYAKEQAKEKGAKLVKILDVSAAFHSPLMEPIVEEMSAFIDSIEFRKPKIPIIQNNSATVESEVANIKENLKKQITGPVKWRDTITLAEKLQVKKCYEVGPKNVLKGLIERMSSTISVETVEGLFVNG